MVIPKSSNIIILWKDDGKWQRTPYTYLPNRNLEQYYHLFLKNTMLTLDYLVEKEALLITFPDGSTINILKQFIDDNGGNVTIRDGEMNQYHIAQHLITFYDNDGIKFRDNLQLPWTRENTRYCSSAALLGHEFIHAYNAQFRMAEYRKRKDSLISNWRNKYPHFPNEEEKLVTLDLGNQVIEKLGEDKRHHYKRNYYPTVSPISTQPAGAELT